MQAIPLICGPLTYISYAFTGFTIFSKDRQEAQADRSRHAFFYRVSIFWLKMYLDISQHLLLNQVLIALAAGFIGWEMTRWTVLWIQKKLPGLQRINARIGALLVALIAVAHIGYIIRVIAHNIFDGPEWRWPTLLDYSDTTGVVIFYTTVTVSIYESAYLFQQWKKHQQKRKD